MIIPYLKYSRFLIFLILFLSCKQKDTGSTATSKTDGTITESTKIELVKLEKDILNRVIHCSGKIDVLPQGKASVYAALNGYVKEINCNMGQTVTKGEVLATLEHQNYIKIQQHFLETKSDLEYYREEYKRKGELVIENAVSIKQMQKAKADFNKAEATFYSIKLQLELIGINPDSINNRFQSSIEVKAPISGYISKINASIGKFMGENEPLYEIVNKDYLYLLLKIPENDLLNVKNGQQITFTIPGYEKAEFKATSTYIGQSINEIDRRLNIHARLNDNNSIFKSSMFINASIQLSKDSAFLLPISCIITENNQNFIFIKNADEYLQVPVSIGNFKNNLVEIINPSEEMISSQIIKNAQNYSNAETLNDK